jgi:Uncharacterised protein family (UPF0158)
MQFEITEALIAKVEEDLMNEYYVYYHLETGKWVSYPDDIYICFIEEDEEAIEFERLKEEVESDLNAYMEIRKISSHDSFRVMEAFAENITNEKLQKRLFAALSGPKSFRKFKDIIDDCDDERQQWFRFRDKAERDRLVDELENMNERIAKKEGLDDDLE